MRRIAFTKHIFITVFSLFVAGAVLASEPEFKEMTWDDLIPRDFDLYSMYDELDFASYNIEVLDDNDPEAQRLFADLMAIHARAPMVEELEGAFAKIPGFVVPLEMTDDLVTSFFLVPYFGACIHTPPPSPNQMVYIETSGIKVKSIDEPVWVSGQLTVETTDNEVGMAGYAMYTDIVTSYYDE